MIETARLALGRAKRRAPYARPPRHRFLHRCAGEGGRLEDTGAIVDAIVAGASVYDDETLQKIIDAAGGFPPGTVKHGSYDQRARWGVRRWTRRKALAQRLQLSANHWAVKVYMARQPPPFEEAKSFRAIARAAQELLETLAVEAGADEPAKPFIRYGLNRAALRHGGSIGGFPDFSSEKLRVGARYTTAIEAPGMVRASIRGVSLLRLWAEQAEQSVAPKIGRTPARKKDEPLNLLFQMLAGIWREVFERRVSFNVGASGTLREGQAAGKLVDFTRASTEPLGLSLSNDAIRDRYRSIFQAMGNSKRAKN